MNVADHKHGGGEGRAPVGLSEPRTVMAYSNGQHEKLENGPSI